MSQKDKIAIFPSRANNVLIKNRLLSAKKGHSMLKKKRDALDLKLREIIAQRRATAANFNDLFRKAIFLIAKVNFLDTDLKPAPIIGSQFADAYMKMSSMKMIGITLTTFEPVLRKPESLALTGLSRGGVEVEHIREAFQELFRLLVVISSFDYSIRVLKEALHVTNMRLNGLEYVIMPRLANTTAYILNELDEMEREEFYRLKRCQKNRKRRAPKEKSKQLDDEESDVELIDAWTFTEEAMFENLIKFRDNQMVQTIITGHLPAPDEFISPTDSLISGIEPIIGKRTRYELWQRPPKRSSATQDSNTDQQNSSNQRNESDPAAPSTVEDPPSPEENQQ